MSRKLKIQVGDVELDVVLNDSETADAVWTAAPFEATGSYWGGEIYFETPVRTGQEPDADDVVEPGAVAYWPPGKCLCIFWGPTPASREDECRAASPVNLVGEVVNRAALFKLGDRRVRVEQVAEESVT